MQAHDRAGIQHAQDLADEAPRLLLLSSVKLTANVTDLGYLRQRLARDIVAFGTEVILGIRQVKVFSAESRLIKRFTEFAHQVSQANLRLVIGICFCCGRPQRPQEDPKGVLD